VSDLVAQRLPDAEQELVAFLRAQPELASLAGRIYTVFPSQAGPEPLVVVRRYGGEPKVGRPLVLDEATCQIEVYGGRKAEASDIARLIQTLLSVRLPRTQLGAFRPVFDETFNPPRPRYLVDVTYYLRPAVPAAAVRRRPTVSAGDPQPTPGGG
jgi:uncharacterized protein DUF3168